MPNAHLLRNESPLPNVLKLKGGMKCMSAKTFAKQKGAMLPQLRTRTDPPPRLMRPGAGAPAGWHAQVRALLEQPVREHERRAPQPLGNGTKPRARSPVQCRA